MYPAENRPGAAATGGSQRPWLELADAELLAESAIDLYRASGPGGQKRNKTASAVRLRHEPTGLIVTAVESRSQHENRTRALKRLREAIALNVRTGIAPDHEPPDFFAAALARDPGLRVNRRHPDYWRVVQYVLDVFFHRRGRVGEAAEALGLSTGRLVRFLKNDRKIWAHANRLREEFGRPALR